MNVWQVGEFTSGGPQGHQRQPSRVGPEVLTKTPIGRVGWAIPRVESCREELDAEKCQSCLPLGVNEGRDECDDEGADVDDVRGRHEEYVDDLVPPGGEDDPELGPEEEVESDEGGDDEDGVEGPGEGGSSVDAEWEEPTGPAHPEHGAQGGHHVPGVEDTLQDAHRQIKP